VPIPESGRIIYRNNPLVEVVCQLKFPPVLRVESELPAEFQEAIRTDYPIYTEPHASLIPEGLHPEIARLVGSILPAPGGKTHEFISEDQTWKLTLCRDFIALKCSKYERWEHFRQRFRGPFDELVQIYRPAFFSRIGLRYQNAIRRRTLGLEGVDWGELLQPYIAGTLSSSISSDVEDVLQVVSLRLPENRGKITMRHGLVRDSTTNEVCYAIDNDFYTEEKTLVADALEKLDYYNGYSGRVFRWSVKERLDRAMEPQPVQ
jgi:uncharacterized protein (TIGR04255 family)